MPYSIKNTAILLRDAESPLDPTLQSYFDRYYELVLRELAGVKNLRRKLLPEEAAELRHAVESLIEVQGAMYK